MPLRGVLALPILAALALPAGAQPAPTAQQERMTACNAEAGTKALTGEARKSFMSDCLSGRTAAAIPVHPPLTAQQDRMKTCNADAAARNLNGEPRQRFMSSCLTGATATGATAAAPVAADSSGRFASEASARQACGGDPVVWANPGSRVFHASGTQFYGKTAEGGFMCRAAAEKAGYKLAGGKG